MKETKQSDSKTASEIQNEIYGKMSAERKIRITSQLIQLAQKLNQAQQPVNSSEEESVQNDR